MAIEQIFHEFIQHALAQKLPIEGVAIADEKKVICEYHFVPDLARNTYSHTKSYTATAVGIAISEGKLSLEDSLRISFRKRCRSMPMSGCFGLHCGTC